MAATPAAATRRPSTRPQPCSGVVRAYQSVQTGASSPPASEMTDRSAKNVTSVKCGLQRTNSETRKASHASRAITTQSSTIGFLRGSVSTVFA